MGTPAATALLSYFLLLIDSRGACVSLCRHGLLIGKQRSAGDPLTNRLSLWCVTPRTSPGHEGWRTNSERSRVSSRATTLQATVTSTESGVPWFFSTRVLDNGPTFYFLKALH